MNEIYVKTAFVIVAGALFFACQNNQTNSNISTTATKKQIYKAVGVIKSIDTDAGKFTIDHEDIAGYMMAMEMTELVKDRSILETVKIGDKVAFELERTGEKLLITKITKIGEVVILNGGEVYKINCAECHGERGAGTKKGLSFLKGHALQHSEGDFIKQVTNGEGKKMPAFKDKLSDEQIAEVVRFVRTDLQKITEKQHGKHSHH